MADDEPKVEQPSTLSEDELLDAKLSAFDAKVKAAGGKRMPETPEWNYKRKNPPTTPTSPASGIAFGLSLLYTLLGPIVAGYLIGLLVEKGSGHAGASSTGALIGLVTGFVAMLFLAYHHMGREDKR